MTTKNKPVHEVKIGRIKAAVWVNSTEGGASRQSVTLGRLYKVGEKQWKTSDSFSSDDLPLVGKVIDQVFAWMVANQPAKTQEKAEE